MIYTRFILTSLDAVNINLKIMIIYSPNGGPLLGTLESADYARRPPVTPGRS